MGCLRFSAALTPASYLRWETLPKGWEILPKGWEGQPPGFGRGSHRFLSSPREQGPQAALPQEGGLPDTSPRSEALSSWH